MRILVHAPHPGLLTGYAQQAGLIIPRLQQLGHQVAISCTGGQEGHPSTWRGIPVFPKTFYEDFGQDVVNGHYAEWKADLCVTLLCAWPLTASAWRNMRVVHLTPVDCAPMGAGDYQFILNGGGMPAAISRHGERMMRAKGLDPLYLPHGIDTQVMAPPDDRDGLRSAIGLEGKFTVGMNFMNNDRLKNRKAVPEQFRAFAMFHEKHPDTLLLVHALMHLPEGHRLQDLVRHLEIADSVIFSDQYRLISGMIPPEEMAAWYGSLDVYSGVAKGEGFGLPQLEAQACGTPVVTMGWSTGPELCGAGWKARGQEEYNDTHIADWHVPDIKSIAACYELAYKKAGQMRAKARRFAMRYDIDRIFKDHWEPVLAALE